jgi:hypothetical protein
MAAGVSHAKIICLPYRWRPEGCPKKLVSGQQGPALGFCTILANILGISSSTCAAWRSIKTILRFKVGLSVRLLDGYRRFL